MLANSNFAYCTQNSMIPAAGVPRVTDIPKNATLVALAPYTSEECSNMIIDQAYHDGASLVIFANDTLLATSQSSGMVSAGTTSVSVLAVSSQTGRNAFVHMAEYNSNNTVQVPGTTIDDTLQRVGIQVQSQLESTLPRLWVFVLAVIAGVLAVIVLLSLLLNFVLYMRRRNLRNRILNGEVNLELLGVKRMTVPQEILDKIPIRIYTHGEQHFHNDDSGSSSPTPGADGAAALGGKGTWKDRLKPHYPRVAVKGSAAAAATAVGASGIGPSRRDIGSGYSQTSCPICLEDFEDKVTPVRELACDHIYHMECIDSFLKTRSSLCPLCKKTTLPAGYLPASLKLTNATVRREREMRRQRRRRGQGHEDVESGIVHPVVSAPGTATDNSIELPAAQTATTHLEALAVTEEEEAAEQRRRPGWRRALQRIFPF
ncbi:hypothetical protein D0Z00_002018 [Geotrichum galactomycetum]|uniref:Uncharacterized protein n=1 Tax=Geotrichum galactomycetum TaxID=27317 RepID=A0ACB6V5C1_9ASCO|nr:hypothetical protein D0Z00_002018 [Geotrichum candidum]